MNMNEWHEIDLAFCEALTVGDHIIDIRMKMANDSYNYWPEIDENGRLLGGKLEGTKAALCTLSGYYFANLGRELSGKYKAAIGRVRAKIIEEIN